MSLNKTENKSETPVQIGVNSDALSGLCTINRGGGTVISSAAKVGWLRDGESQGEYGPQCKVNILIY